MKRFYSCLALALMLMTLLLCFVGCVNGQKPNDDLTADPPATPGEPDAPATPEDPKPGFQLPEHLTLPEGVEPAENEIIYQVPITSPQDTRSYIRLVFSDESRETLTEVYLHHGVGKKRYEETQLARVFGGDVMIVSYYSDNPTTRTQQPTVVVFCEYEVETEADGKVLMATSATYQFFEEKSDLGSSATGVAGWYPYYRLIDTQHATRPSWKYETDKLLVLRSYDNYYENVFEQCHGPEAEAMNRNCRFDLIYSNVGGEEVMLQKDLAEFIPFPWTRMNTVP